ncbi:MAG: hypothetical protein ACRDZ4_11445 [Egibacteraceae bacterium]
MSAKQDREQIAKLRERLLTQGRSVAQILEASWLVSTCRYSRRTGWRGVGRAKAVEAILATYDVDGWGVRA